MFFPGIWGCFGEFEVFVGEICFHPDLPAGTTNQPPFLDRLSIETDSPKGRFGENVTEPTEP